MRQGALSEDWLSPTPIPFARAWWPGRSDTFAIRPIKDFVQRHLAKARVSVDPFARNCCWATWTNDIDPGTQAAWHLDAEAFLRELGERGVVADLCLFDPPYSPEQLVRTYKQVSAKADQSGSHNGHLYARCRDALLPVLSPDAVVLSFGWNSCGMGRQRGFQVAEILLVAHGGAHNDTICLAERRKG